MQQQTFTREEAEQVKNCQQCNASLERGWCWNGEDANGEHRITRVWCFKCAEEERWAEYQKGKVIVTRLLTDNIWRKDPDLAKSIDAIHAKVKEFEREVWFGGMQKTIVASSRSGMSYESNGLKVMSFCTAARCMITIEGERGQVTVITEEKSPEARMGLQGICATEEEALSLLERAIQEHKAGVCVRDDDKVGIF